MYRPSVLIASAIASITSRSLRIVPVSAVDDARHEEEHEDQRHDAAQERRVGIAPVSGLRSARPPGRPAARSAPPSQAPRARPGERALLGGDSGSRRRLGAEPGEASAGS
jgi:hypothetical protein